MIERNKIEEFLKTDFVTKLENNIADQIGGSIYRENLPLLAGFIGEEIRDSNFDFNDLKISISENEVEIAEFGFNFLKDSKISNLSSGIAVTYAIYLTFLKEKESNELLEYLKKRRIPNPQNIFKKL